MIFYLGALVLATYISASAALPPCVCTRDLKFVCGTDGNTYNNQCLLDCARSRGKTDLAVARPGKCDFPGIQTEPNDCICTLEHMPVCGSNGKTYPNGCAMDCENRMRNTEVVKAHNGECRQKRELTLPDSPCICTLEYRPVCASDGNSYPNRCSMDCQARARGLEIVKVHDGDCRPKRDTVKVADLGPCVCTKEKKPVCGTDGHTYSNPCILRCAKQAKADLDIQHGGSCKKVESVIPDIPNKFASCTCTRNLEPVCATDGESYPNICLMRCAGAELKSMGPCDGVYQQVAVAENSS